MKLRALSALCVIVFAQILKCKTNFRMKKTLKAVSPFIHPGFLNFKMMPYEAWKRNGEKWRKRIILGDGSMVLLIVGSCQRYGRAEGRRDCDLWSLCR